MYLKQTRNSTISQLDHIALDLQSDLQRLICQHPPFASDWNKMAQALKEIYEKLGNGC